MAVQQTRAETRGSERSRPYEPRCTPVSAISRKPAVRTRAIFGKHLAERPAPAVASCRRDDAVGARLVAAGLDPKRVGRAARQPWSHRRAARAVAVAKSLGGRQADLFGKRVLPIVGNDLHHAGQRRDLVGPPRGVAARDDDAGGRILPRNFPDDLAGALIGSARHRAGVHDHQVGVRESCGRPAVRDQLLFNLQGVGLIDAAAERDDGVLHLSLLAFAAFSTFSASPRLVFLEALRNGLVAERKNLRREHAGVGRAGLADRHRRHGNARRHLHGRQQRVEAVQRGRIDRHADHRLGDVCGDDAGQMRGRAGADNEDADAPRAASSISRCTRSGDRCAEATSSRPRCRAPSARHGALHDRRVVLRAHQNHDLEW